MGSNNDYQTIPHLAPGFNPTSHENNLNAEEIKIITYIDGKANVAELASLTQFPIQDVLDTLEYLEGKGVVALRNASRGARSSAGQSGFHRQQRDRLAKLRTRNASDVDDYEESRGRKTRVGSSRKSHRLPKRRGSSNPSSSRPPRTSSSKVALNATSSDSRQRPRRSQSPSNPPRESSRNASRSQVPSSSPRQKRVQQTPSSRDFSHLNRSQPKSHSVDKPRYGSQRPTSSRPDSFHRPDSSQSIGEYDPLSHNPHTIQDEFEQLQSQKPEYFENYSQTSYDDDSYENPYGTPESSGLWSQNTPQDLGGSHHPTPPHQSDWDDLPFKPDHAADSDRWATPSEAYPPRSFSVEGSGPEEDHPLSSPGYTSGSDVHRSTSSIYSKAQAAEGQGLKKREELSTRTTGHLFDLAQKQPASLQSVDDFIDYSGSSDLFPGSKPASLAQTTPPQSVALGGHPPGMDALQSATERANATLGFNAQDPHREHASGIPIKSIPGGPAFQDPSQHISRPPTGTHPIPNPTSRPPTNPLPMQGIGGRPPTNPLPMQGIGGRPATNPLPMQAMRPPTGPQPMQAIRPPTGTHPLPKMTSRPPTNPLPMKGISGRPPTNPLPMQAMRPPTGPRPMQAIRPPTGTHPIPNPTSRPPTNPLPMEGIGGRPPTNPLPMQGIGGRPATNPLPMQAMRPPTGPRPMPVVRPPTGTVPITASGTLSPGMSPPMYTNTPSPAHIHTDAQFGESSPSDLFYSVQENTFTGEHPDKSKGNQRSLQKLIREIYAPRHIESGSGLEWPALSSDQHFEQMKGEDVPEVGSEANIYVTNMVREWIQVLASVKHLDPRDNTVKDDLVSWYATTTGFLRKYNELLLTIHPQEIFYDGRCIYRNVDREYSLACTLFSNGIRSIRFVESVSLKELVELTEAIAIQQSGIHQFEENLSTLLWKAEFEHIEFVVAEYCNKNARVPVPQYTQRLFDKALRTNITELRDKRNQLLSALDEEELRVLLESVQPEPVYFQPVRPEELAILQDENAPAGLLNLTRQLLRYLEREIRFAKQPMTNERFKELLIGYRNYLLIEGKLAECVELFKYLKSHQTPIQGILNPRLSPLFDELISAFREKSWMRRFVDGIQLNQSQTKVPEYIFEMLELFNFDPTSLLFELLSNETYKPIRKTIRLVLVQLSKGNCHFFSKHFENADDAFTVELLLCLHSLSTPDALDKLIEQIQHPNPEIQALVFKLLDESSKKDQQSEVRTAVKRLMNASELPLRIRAYKLIQLSKDGYWITPLLEKIENPRGAAEELKQVARLSAYIYPEGTEPVLVRLCHTPSVTDEKQQLVQLHAAIAGLSVVASPGAEQAIETLLNERPDELREPCIEALRHIKETNEDSLGKSEFSFGPQYSIDNLPPVASFYTPEALPAVVRESLEDAFMQLDVLDSEVNRPSDFNSEDTNIQKLQKHLHQTLQHADAAYNDNFTILTRKAAHRFVILLHNLLEDAKPDQPKDQGISIDLMDFAELQERLIERLGTIDLVTIDGQLYLNQLHLRLPQQSQSFLEHVQENLQKLGLGRLSIIQPMTSAKLRIMIQMLAGIIPAQNANDLAGTQSFLRDQGLDKYIEVQGLPIDSIPLNEATQTLGTQKTILQAYAKAYAAMGSLCEAAAQGRMPDLLRLRGVCIELVDAFRLEEEVHPLEVISFDLIDKPLETHTLNVITYSLLLGKTLQLSRRELSDLAMAAFFHDIGYMLPVNASEQIGIRQPHTSRALRFLAKQPGFQEAKIKRLLAVFDHHEELPPPESQLPRPALYSRIIQIADVYDRLTLPLQPISPMPPPLAIQYIWSGRDRFFDPSLAQLFINAMGKYPIGSLVELNDGGWGVSMGHDGNPKNFERPKILMVRDPQQNYIEGPIIDLGNPDNYKLSPTKVLPSDHAIQPKQLLAKALQRRSQ